MAGENIPSDDLEPTVVEETTTDPSLPTTDTGGESVDAPVVETSTSQTESDAPKSLLEAIDAGIATAQKPRRIESKSTDDTRPRNPDGTFKTETDEEKTAREAAEAEAALAAETPEAKAARLAAETPEEKAAREAKEAAVKKPDFINDPIPENLNKKTAERMRYLADTVKAQNVLVEQHGQFMAEIQSTGASPQEFGAMVNYMRAVHSTDEKVLQSAYDMLKSELRGLAVKMGKPLYEVNLLREAENADLVEEIRSGTLTSDRAHEIALQRESVKHTRAVNTRVTATQTAEQSRLAGVAALDKFDAEMRAKDGLPLFNEKYRMVVAALKDTITRTDPKEWDSMVRSAYNNLSWVKVPVAVVPTAAAAPVTTTPAVLKQQPIRPKTPAGNTAPGPKSALEALNNALDGM